MKNIFIVGPVASGKNTLMEKIMIESNSIAVDTGQIYRYLASKIIDELHDQIDFLKIQKNDEDECLKLVNKTYSLTKFYTNELGKLKFKDNEFYELTKPVDLNKLYSTEVNMILPIICKISTLRGTINNYINNYICNNERPIIMTGHNIKEIDTTKFIVVFLDVDSKSSSYRLYMRNKSSYESQLDAFDEVIKRNQADKIDYTRKSLKYLYNYIYIDTENKNPDEIYEEFLKSMKKIEERQNNYQNQQLNSIKRENFEWIFNPVLQPLKQQLEKLSIPLIEKYPFINKNDLIYQTLIKLASYEITELYDLKESLTVIINNSIENRNSENISRFIKSVEDGIIKINEDLLLENLSLELNILINMYNDDKIRNIMNHYNESGIKKNLKHNHGLMVNAGNGLMDEKISYKILDQETSKLISKYCHYLHTPRNDELVSYGAFVDDNPYPIAYVSFSRQDREYKKQLLYNLGIEPQNTIEMTRAWCSNNAPQNIMSSLFQYSINDISKRWKENCKIGREDKYLQAVTTAINPNLGFKASSFLGCNFIPIALRPAKFTFSVHDGIIKYTTRRTLENESSETEYFENMFNILPLNELILCLDKNKRSIINNSNIMIIDNKSYEKVLDGVSYVKKKRRKENEKNIDSN